MNEMNDNIEMVDKMPRIYERIKCTCGRSITKQNHSSHLKSMIHSNWLERERERIKVDNNDKINELYEYIKTIKKNENKE